MSEPSSPDSPMPDTFADPFEAVPSSQRARRIMASRRVVGPAIPSVPDEAPVSEGLGKVVEATHYVTRWQLWSVAHRFQLLRG
jgi:hypothetical protein